MGTVPTPLSATATSKISAAGFNAGVRDALAFLLDPPRCDVALGANISCVDATATLVAFDGEVLDTDNMHNTVTNTSRILFNTPGRYNINIFMMWSSQVINRVVINMRLNSGGSAAGGSSIRSWDYNAGTGIVPAQQTISMQRTFAAGDYIEIFVTQASGGTRPLQGGNGQFATGLQAQWTQIS
jgi:hypothetical protein